MLTDDKNLIEIYQDYIDDEGYVQRYNYDKGRYYNTGTCLRGPKGNCGNPGRPGKDGLTPRINQDNGHWMIGDVDTGVIAVGGQSDWNQNDDTKLDYIKNKPTISSGSVILNDSYGAFDLSVHNAVNGVPATYVDLSAALTALNALSAEYKKPGMNLRFVRSSDNKYVQYRLMTQTFSTDVADWQGIDEEPIDDSHNLVQSGGVFNQLYENFGGYTELTPVQTYSSSYLFKNGNLGTGGSDKVVAEYDVDGMTQVAVTGYSINAPEAVLACAYNSNFAFLQYYYERTNQGYDKVPIQLPANTKYLRICYTTSYLGGAFSGSAPLLSLLKSKFVIFDVSEYNKSGNTPTIYNNPSSAIAAIPEQMRVAGMLIKYIHGIYATYFVDKTDGLTTAPTGTLLNSDPAIEDGIYVASQLNAFSNLPSNIGNKVTYYIQVSETSYTKWEITKSSTDSSAYTVAKFLLSGNFENSDFLDVRNWQGVDEKPIEQSVNIPTSGGVATSLFDLRSEIAENVDIYNNILSLPANATSIAITLEKGYFYRFYIYRSDSSERLSIYTNTKFDYDAATIKLVGNLLAGKSEKIFDFVTDRDSTYLYLINKNASAISVHLEIVKNILPKGVFYTKEESDEKFAPYNEVVSSPEIRLTPIDSQPSSYYNKYGEVVNSSPDKGVMKFDVEGLTSVGITCRSPQLTNAVAACAWDANNNLLQYYFLETGISYNKESIELPANAKYLGISYSVSRQDSGAYILRELNFYTKGQTDEKFATKEDIEDRGIVPNPVRREDDRQIPVSANLLSTYTLGTGWSVNDGVFTHSGGNGVITYDFNTISGKKYVLTLSYTSGTGVEGGLFVQLGSDINTLVDCYNGSANVIIGFIGNGQSPRLITSQSLSITNIQLREVVGLDDAVSIIEYHPINVFASRWNDDVTSYWNIALGSSGTLSHSQNSTRNIALGFRTLESLITGTRNVALGTFALHKLERGNRNVAIGSDALWYPISADENVVIGYGAVNAMNTNMAINHNVVIGSRAMPGVFTLASYNVIIGYSAGVNGLSSVTNAIALGYNAKATKSNQCVIGNSSVSEFVLGNKKLIFNQDGTVSWEPVS